MPVRDPRRASIPMEEGALSRRVGTKTGALEARTETPSTEVAATDFDPRAESNTLRGRQEELAALQGTEKATGLGQLGSAESLIKLGLALAGGLSGNQTLQHAGLGLGLGTIQGASGQAQDMNAERQKRIDDLTKLVDSQQQRLSTLMTQAPGGFVDDQGNNVVPPEEWQDLLALNVPYNPANLLANAREGKNDIAQYGVAESLIQQGISAKNPALVREGLQIVNKVGQHGWTDDYMARMADANPASLVRILMEENEPASVVAALDFANENGVSLASPGALRLLMAKTASDSWKIDSIDDQIKVDAYQALQWFNQEWMNESTEGVPNRERYRANPHEALQGAFEGNPAGWQALMKVFPATQFGQELAKTRVDALMKAWAPHTKMQSYIEGAMSSDPVTRANALFSMAQSVNAQANVAQGVATLGTAVSESATIGQRFINTHPAYQNANPGVASHIGATINSMAHRMAQAKGIGNLSQQPYEVRVAYQTQAMKLFDEQQKSLEVIEPEQPAAEPAAPASPEPAPEPEKPERKLTAHEERIRDYIGKE